MAKVNYSEGDCFSVPLRNGGFARGVIARMDGEGIVFGYFFGPIVIDEKKLDVNEEIAPGYEIMKGQFGDLGLLKRKWKIIGHIDNWDRNIWDMPKFLRWEEGDKKGVLCTYDDETLALIEEKPIKVASVDIHNYLPDRLMGYGSVEIKLTRLLESGGSGHP